ncbi:hypothetical protein ACUN0C_18785 [Faunimonas sp. B44]|uniref:hypothetical protein n=1 Tax=Faunimonas sp. B44 TaxID=3461493 RepID=UPI004043ADC9
MADIGYEKCPCGHRGCSKYFLTGIGDFVQGSGFTLEEAERIVSALNAVDALLAFAEDQAARMNAAPDPRPPSGDDWNDLFAEVMALKTMREKPDFATLRAKVMVQYPKTLEYLAARDETEVERLRRINHELVEGFSNLNQEGARLETKLAAEKTRNKALEEALRWARGPLLVEGYPTEQIDALLKESKS